MITTDRDSVYNFKIVPYAAGAVERAFGEDLVDPFHGGDVGFIHFGFVVEAGPRNAE